MEERSIQFGKVEIILGTSSRWLKIIVVVLLVVSAVALTALAWAETDMRRQTAQMKGEAAEYMYANEQLREQIADLGSMESIERIAREELNMVTPGTVLIEAQVK